MTRPNLEHLDRLWEEGLKVGAVTLNLERSLKPWEGRMLEVAQSIAQAYPELSAYIRELEDALRTCREEAIEGKLVMKQRYGWRGTDKEPFSRFCAVEKAATSALETP